MPENLMGTLTSSDYDFTHTSRSTKFRYTSCAAATWENLNPFRFVDYIRIIDFSSDLLEAFFFGETISIRYSTTLKS